MSDPNTKTSYQTHEKNRTRHIQQLETHMCGTNGHFNQ